MNGNLKKEPVLSSRKRRVAAFLIDYFAFLLVVALVLTLGTDFMGENGFDGLRERQVPAIIIALLLYFAKDSIKGISPGKWAMGIMVRDENNPHEVPSFGSLFIRNLFLIILPIEIIVLASSQEKKRLGDKTTKAIVVKNPNRPARLPRILTLVVVGLSFYAFIFFLVASEMKESDAYKVAITEIEKNNEILSETGGITGYGMIPTGHVNFLNGNGEAQLEIKVLGNEKDFKVDVLLTKELNGEWKLKELNKKR